MSGKGKIVNGRWVNVEDGEAGFQPVRKPALAPTSAPTASVGTTDAPETAAASPIMAAKARAAAKLSTGPQPPTPDQVFPIASIADARRALAAGGVIVCRRHPVNPELSGAIYAPDRLTSTGAVTTAFRLDGREIAEMYYDLPKASEVTFESGFGFQTKTDGEYLFFRSLSDARSWVDGNRPALQVAQIEQAELRARRAREHAIYEAERQAAEQAAREAREAVKRAAWNKQCTADGCHDLALYERQYCRLHFDAWELGIKAKQARQEQLSSEVAATFDRLIPEVNVLSPGRFTINFIGTSVLGQSIHVEERNVRLVRFRYGGYGYMKSTQRKNGHALRTEHLESLVIRDESGAILWNSLQWLDEHPVKTPSLS